MIPTRDQTGTPKGLLGLIHLRSSMISGSASWMRRRTSDRVAARQWPRDRCSSVSPGAVWPAVRRAFRPGLAFAAAFDGDLALTADWRGWLARDVSLDLGFGLL